MTAAVFDWAVWSARYPELVARGVTQLLANSFWDEATLLVDNGPCSIVSDVAVRAILLNMATAHIAALSPATGGSGAVGRVSSASEGSVSTSLDYGTISTSQAYWVQTPYGAQFWQATAPYRTARYVPGRSRYFGFGYRPGPFGYGL